MRKTLETNPPQQHRKRYPFPAELAEREAEFDDSDDDRYAQAVAAHLGRLAIAGTVSTMLIRLPHTNAEDH